MRNKGKLLSNRQILINVWGPGYTEYDTYIRVAVSELRASFGEKFKRGELHKHECHSMIKAKHGQGYIMADLDAATGEAAAPPAIDIAAPSLPPSGDPSLCRGCAILPDLLAVMRDVRDLLLQIKHPLHEVTSGPEALPVVKIDVPSVYDKVCPKTGGPHDIRPGDSYHYCNDCEHSY